MMWFLAKSVPRYQISRHLAEKFISLDTYEYLLPAGDEGTELEAGERALMALGS
jgi:hypothetical protein